MIINTRLYKIMKRLVMLILPACGTLYFVLGTVWDWPNIGLVLGFIVTTSTFFGIILITSTQIYNQSDVRFDGAMDIYTTEADVKVYSLTLNANPEDLDNKEFVSFKVNRS